jgi:hypothetical protein
MPEVKTFGDKLTLNFEMLIRIETTLKLNPIYKDGIGLIKDHEKDDEEVHFVRFESVVQAYEIRMGSILRLFKELIKKPDLQFSNWTITDIDQHLNGNPHIEE